MATSKNLGSVQFETGVNGLPKLILRHASGATAEVYRLGAHVASWKAADGRERLFLSRKSLFEEGTPIRGGIPVIFPQFGDGPLPKHGLVRTRSWAVKSAAVEADGTVEAVLALESDAATLAAWPFPFALELAVRLGSGLALALRVRNPGTAPMPFQAAFHTYFAVDSIHEAQVVGLQGCDYLDSLRNRVRETEARPAITFAAETDRIYPRVPDELHLDGSPGRRRLAIRQRQMPDAVVWNPWIAKAQALPDFGDDEYLAMVCVETGTLQEVPPLAPGATWEGVAAYSLLP
ncbi:MAG: D-hexose-6-phosphate mutarotase [Lentisphaeria bacterium]